MDLASLVDQVASAAPMPSLDYAAPDAKLVAHIDGDYLAYYAAGSNDTAAGTARRNVLHRVDKIRFLTGASRVVMHLTSGMSTKGDRFLAATSKPYQGQRTGSKPVNWHALRDYMEGHNGSIFEPKLWTTREADDGIAYVTHTMAESRGQLQVIHTADKDMRMFAGLHVNWKTWQKTEVPLGAFDVLGADGLQYGHKWFWLQMLKGDTADFIPGLPGVGDATADAALRGATCNEEAYDLVSKLYLRKMGTGRWADYLVEQAALLWMRVDRDASLLDFLRLGVFDECVHEAAFALADKVQQRKDNLEALRA